MFTNLIQIINYFVENHWQKLSWNGRMAREDYGTLRMLVDVFVLLVDVVALPQQGVLVSLNSCVFSIFVNG